MNNEKIVLVARLKVKEDAVEEAQKAALAIVRIRVRKKGISIMIFIRRLMIRRFLSGTKRGRTKPLWMNILKSLILKNFSLKSKNLPPKSRR